MGIFNFLKDVGHKLLDNSEQSAAAGTEAGQQLAQKIQAQLEKLNLGIEAPQVTVQGDKATLTGNAASQEAFEKAILAVGNTMGIGQVDAQLKTAAANSNAAAPNFYTVKSGDTLSKIAKEAYGNANAYQQIFEANKPMLKSPDEIFPGQQLRIPPQQKAAA